jgi:branched-chain amino acid transport system substrate-binding protein
MTLLGLLIAACAGAGTPEAPELGGTYKIGFMAAITGRAAFLGEPERDAALMMVAQLKDAGGGVTGPDGVFHPVEILIEDTEGNPDVAITLAKKFIDQDGVVLIVGGTRSPVSVPVAVSVIESAKTPFISMASSSAIVEPVEERYWTFKTPQSNKHVAPVQVAYLQALGITKIASLYVNNAFGEDSRQALQDAIVGTDIKIVVEDAFESDDTDFTAQLTKVKASDAQALVVHAIPPAASSITVQFRELGLDIPLVHNHGVGMKPFIDLAGEAANGVVFPIGKMIAAESLSDDDPQKQLLLDFISDYEAFSGNPRSTFAGHAWDGLQWALACLKTLPDGISLEEQRAQCRDAIEGLTGFIGTGGAFNLSPTDHVGLSSNDLILVRVENQDWVYYPPAEWGK